MRSAVADFINPKKDEKTVEKSADSMDVRRSGVVWSLSYDGEKNFGEIGPAINYTADYDTLRIRSWQSYLESDITKTVIDRYLTWVIGKGLKLQASPMFNILNQEIGFDLDKKQQQNFNNGIEERYKLWSGSVRSTYSENFKFSETEKEVLKNALVGGDCLVVIRYIDNEVKVQLIDGQHIQTPSIYQIPNNAKNVVHGVELDDRGRHVAYHIRKKGLIPTWERISAYGEKTGNRIAFMVYGSRYRIDSVRGMPLMSTVLETLKKLERYKEATVGSAEERQKIAYQIVHGINSTGENPLQKRLAQAMDPDSPSSLPSDSYGVDLARTVAVSTQKEVFNMPQDAKLEQLESKNELYFKDFYDTNFDGVCSAIGIAPNVAKMLYDDNFSASRAALKDWEHSLGVIREYVSGQFHSRVYSYWLWAQVMKSKIQAVGYLNAYVEKDFDVIEAFSSARWVGAQVPHIDPLKEVKAEREKLGTLAAHLPLTSLEQATENLGEGESTENVDQFADELKQAESLGVSEPKPEPTIIEADPNFVKN
tara:strand:- start:3508 stop:5118 length:1611 start_codon:yes stop_codon:yes gene_type:complete